MVFPKSNLSTSAQPWGRFVEKSITNLEALVATEKVNNAARDAQAALSIKRLDASVVSVAIAAKNAQDSIDAITSLGSADSPYTINAGNINGGTITGVNIIGNTIKSAATGTRVEIAGTDIKFYYGTSIVGRLFGTNYSGSDSMAMLYQDTEYGVYLQPQGGLWYGPHGMISLGTYGPGMQYDFSHAINVLSTGVSVTGALGSTGQISASSFYTEGNVRGVTLTAATSASITSITTSLDVDGALNTKQTLRRSTLAGGTLTGASITADGYFQRTTSSARYKQDIEDLNISYNDILQLKPKKFRRKDEVESNPDARYYAGFVAEEIAGTPLDIFAFYQSEKDGGLPDGVHYPELTSALVIAIKHQDAIIKNLTSRIEILEGK